MAEGEPYVISKILIERGLTSDGQDIVWTTSSTADGKQELPLIEALGMLEMAKDTVVRSAMGELS